MFSGLFTELWSNSDLLFKVLFIAGFGIPFCIFIYRAGKNIGRVISFITDIIKQTQNGND
jgi:hypothetical protein